jgi:hypothetical protein
VTYQSHTSSRCHWTISSETRCSFTNVEVFSVSHLIMNHANCWGSTRPMSGWSCWWGRTDSNFGKISQYLVIFGCGNIFFVHWHFPFNYFRRKMWHIEYSWRERVRIKLIFNNCRVFQNWDILIMVCGDFNRAQKITCFRIFLKMELTKILKILIFMLF